MEKKELADELTQQIIKGLEARFREDKKYNERYGTSVDEFMSKQFQKAVFRKVKDLLDSFQVIDIDQSKTISLEELTRFLNEKNPTQTPLSSQDVQEIFDIIDVDKDKEISILEFVQSFVKFEVDLSLTSAKLESIADELEEKKSKFEESKEKAQDEEQIDNGLTTKSLLSISVIEALNLSEPCDAFFQIEFENKKETSRLIKNTNNPAWNEEYNFKVTNRDAILTINFYKKGNMLVKQQLLGKYSIPLVELQNIEDKYRDIKLPGTNITIRLRIQLILNLKNYIKTNVEKIKDQINLLRDTKKELDDNYLSHFESDLGIFYYRDVINFKEKINRCKEIIQAHEKNREFKYALNRSTDYKREILVGDKKITITNGAWGIWHNILMLIIMILTLISSLERTDFPGLSICFFEIIIYAYDNFSIDNRVFIFIRQLIFGFIASIIYDLVWLLMQFDNFLEGQKDDLEIDIKQVAYFVTGVNMFCKLFMAYTLNKIKRSTI